MITKHTILDDTIQGKCLYCGKIDYLGDGLCQKCWDTDKMIKPTGKKITSELNRMVDCGIDMAK